ncbi:hypothetical protein [Nocardioides daejeonensis]|nr:hypothetical protein [Nocardioides daejeonensis]
MTTALILLLALAGLLVVVGRMIRNDGHGSRAANELPRSHPRDLFDPARR